MKTIIFVVLIIASASYLAVGEKSPLSVSDDGSTVSVDVEKISADMSTKLNEQLVAFKNEISKDQQRQIEALQQSVVNLAQKTAKLERMLADSKNTSQLAVAPVQSQVYQAPSVASVSEGPDVGAIKKPVDFDSPTDLDNIEVNDIHVDDTQTLAQVSNTSDSADVTESNFDMAMMDKQQRRKRLQALSERMTLKSLGIEK